MAEETDKFTENEITEAAAPAEPEDMQANLDSLQEALASLSAVVGTVAAATATKGKKKK